MRRRRLMPWEMLARWTDGARSALRTREVRTEFPTHIYYAKQDEWAAEVRRLGGAL
jgi:hypothetical protein